MSACPLLSHRSHVLRAGVAPTVNAGVGVARWRLPRHLPTRFGHLGDCNLHICVGTPRDAPSLTPHLEPFLFEWTAAHGGSISAEHGVGQSKRDLMGLQRSPQVLDVMAQVRAHPSCCVCTRRSLRRRIVSN